MASETEQQQQEQQAESEKYYFGMMHRYQPQAGRADRSATNIPGNFTSEKDT